MSEQVVRLLGYPVELGLSVAEHVQDWVREFRLMALSRDTHTGHEVPARLQQVVDQLGRQYAQEMSEPDRLRAAAAGRGESTVDLTYPALPESAEVVVAWQHLLDEVDRYCRAEDLLTLQRTPEQVALTEWISEQFVGQLRGESPRPWPGPSA